MGYWRKVFVSINKRKLLSVCVCLCHSGLPIARRALKIFLWVHFTRSLCAWAEIFDICISFFLIQQCDMLFFHWLFLNWFFYTLNSIYELDFFTVWAADISTSNKNKFWKSMLWIFFKKKLIFESSAICILPYNASRVPSLPYH